MIGSVICLACTPACYQHAPFMNSAFFKKNWYFFTPAVIVVVPALMMAYSTVNYGYPISESLNSVMHYGSTGTRYAMGFSERNFKMVRPGMDGRAVFNLLRVPMEGNSPGAEVTKWRYSLPASGVKYYHERSVVMAMDKNGIQRVKETISHFHPVN